MKASFTVSFLAILVSASALKAIEKLPTLDIADGHFTPGGLDSLSGVVERDENGLEKRACGGCYPYLCDGRCCQFSKCCTRECCQPATTGCTKAGRCIIRC